MRFIFILLASLVSLTAHAFNVTVDADFSGYRFARVDIDLSEFDEDSYHSTGAWSGIAGLDDGYEIGQSVTARMTSSDVPVSGSYSNYSLTMAGWLNINYNNAGAGIRSRQNLAFDEDVNYAFSCIASGSSPTVNVSGIGQIGCGDNGVLSAGTYTFQMDFQSRIDGYHSLTAADLAFTTAVPIPAAAWLFGSALAGLGWVRRKQIA